MPVPHNVPRLFCVLSRSRLRARVFVCRSACPPRAPRVPGRVPARRGPFFYNFDDDVASYRRLGDATVGLGRV